jgi:hypothetical protein
LQVFHGELPDHPPPSDVTGPPSPRFHSKYSHEDFLAFVESAKSGDMA